MSVPIDLGQARLYVDALTGSFDTPLTWQTFTDRKPDPCPPDWKDPLAKIFHGTVKDVANELRALSALGAGVFVMVNAGDGKGRANRNVKQLRALYVDSDDSPLRPAALRPSFTVRSGGEGRGHAYWRLEPGADLGAFTPAQKLLIAWYGADPSVHELCRVMRVPGFPHQKAEPRPVTYAPGCGASYALAEVLAAHALTSAERLVLQHARKRDWTPNNRHASAKTAIAHARHSGLSEDAACRIFGDILEAHGKPRNEAERLVRDLWRDIPEPPPRPATTPAEAPPEAPREGREAAAAKLVKIGAAYSYLFSDERGAAHAAIGPDGERQIVPVGSGAYTRFLSGKFYMAEGKAPSGEAISAARNVIGFKATFEGQRHELHNRFAFVDGALWIDLANQRQEAAKVTADGWSIEHPPILFRRFRAQTALPTPATSGDLKRFLDFVNVKAEDQLLVLAALTCIPLGHIARPIILLTGPQGAAKTTTAKMLRRLTDPSAAATNRLSHHDDELALTFESNAVPLFDNVVKVPDRASELLCQAVTGGGFSKRELYTDSDEIVYSFRRAVLMTGINVPSTAPDLLDRCLLVGLERVDRASRKTDAALWRDFDQAAPVIFAGLLDTLSAAMAAHGGTTEKVVSLQRMADFTLWGASVAHALGSGREAFLSAYAGNVDRQTEEVLEADPLARAIRELVKPPRGGFEGSSSELWALLKSLYGDEMKADGWPRNVRAMGHRINVLLSTLADSGVRVSHDRTTSGRTVTIAPGSKPRTSSSSSCSSYPAREAAPGMTKSMTKSDEVPESSSCPGPAQGAAHDEHDEHDELPRTLGGGFKAVM